MLQAQLNSCGGKTNKPQGKFCPCWEICSISLSLSLLLSTQLWTALMSFTIYVDGLKTGRKLLSVRIVARRQEEGETDGSEEAFHQRI